MAAVLMIISKICFVLSGLGLIGAVFFWFKYDIPEVYGDLSGRTAKKSIEEIRQANEKGGDREFRSSVVNEMRGKLTGAMSGMLRKKKTEQDSKPAFAETGILADNKVSGFNSNETEVLNAETNETEVLEPGMYETEVLESNETELLKPAGSETELLVSDETTLLTDCDNETTLLGCEETVCLKEETLSEGSKQNKLAMIEEEIFIHTDKTI